MTQKWVVVPWEQFNTVVPSGSGAVAKLSTDSILAAIPKQSRRDASAILQHIERTSDISWNDKGELVLKGKVVPYTHISDLLKDSFYQYKNWSAEGAPVFYQALAESNIPLGLIHNQQRRTLLEGYKHPKPPGIQESTWVKWK